LKRFAVIDLGSNTFHLLISDVDENGKLTEVFRERAFTFLSDGGIEHIREERIQEGWRVLQTFKSRIIQYNPVKIRIIGTAVLRSASNRKEFIDGAESIFGIPVEIIDGNTEADYIYKGITISKELHDGRHLIMDVGGGSTEFILIEDKKKILAESFTLGAGVLHAKFHQNDPITKQEIMDITFHIQKTMDTFFQKCQELPLKSLVGASGSFEILESMVSHEVSTTEVTKVDLETFKNLYNTIVQSSIEERLKMPGLPPERVKLIVVGMILKKAIIEMFKPEYILVSPYALKEGILLEMASE
jgi:exopolyphosphatase / guanosine-5'-triphosphate,3'-diphosphate pyrophosphatase